jgi:Uma2 family endonuclease
VIPDIAVVRAEAARDADVSLPAPAMLAVIEIVSPTTHRIDRLVKPSGYAEAGIPDCWRLELHPAPDLTVFSLDAGRYREIDTPSRSPLSSSRSSSLGGRRGVRAG